MKYVLAIVGLCYFFTSIVSSNSFAETKKIPYNHAIKISAALKQAEQKEFTSLRLEVTSLLNQPLSTLLPVSSIQYFVERSELLKSSKTLSNVQKAALQDQIAALHTLAEETVQLFENRFEQCSQSNDGAVFAPGINGITPIIQFSIDKKMSDHLSLNEKSLLA